MFDQWYFKIPLAFKPTYLNMEMNFSFVCIFDLIVDVHWNLHALHFIFGEHLHASTLSLGKIDHDDPNHWV